MTHRIQDLRVSIMLIYKSFHGIKVLKRTRFLYGKLQMGNNSAKNVDGVPFLVSACRLFMLYICANFHEIISNGIKVIEWTPYL